MVAAADFKLRRGRIVLPRKRAKDNIHISLLLLLLVFSRRFGLVGERHPETAQPLLRQVSFVINLHNRFARCEDLDHI